MAAAEAAAALAAYGVDLVYEYNRRGDFLGLVKEVTNTGGADADVELDEVEPDMDRNCTPASPATALASRVLPVPGGPTSSTPLGMRAPISV